MSSPDLAALETVNPLRHFGAQAEDPGEGEDGWEDARAALRAAMGSSYADAPTDGELEAALATAVRFLEAATGRTFVARSGTLDVDGTGTDRLFLPLPVVSTNQAAAGGVTEILIGDDTTAIDAEAYTVNDGVGLPGRDPRAHPFVDLVGPSSGGFVSRPVTWGTSRTWPAGTRNVHVTALWGYLDETGETPDLARRALAALTIRAMVRPDDQDALDDLHLGAVQSEATRDRSVTYGPRAGGAGISTDRELDLLIAQLRAPPLPRVPRSPARRVPRARDGLLRPFRGY